MRKFIELLFQFYSQSQGYLLNILIRTKKWFRQLLLDISEYFYYKKLHFILDYKKNKELLIFIFKSLVDFIKDLKIKLSEIKALIVLNFNKFRPKKKIDNITKNSQINEDNYKKSSLENTKTDSEVHTIKGTENLLTSKNFKNSSKKVKSYSPTSDFFKPKEFSPENDSNNDSLVKKLLGKEKYLQMHAEAGLDRSRYSSKRLFGMLENLEPELKIWIFCFIPLSFWLLDMALVTVDSGFFPKCPVRPFVHNDSVISCFIIMIIGAFIPTIFFSIRYTNPNHFFTKLAIKFMQSEILVPFFEFIVHLSSGFLLIVASCNNFINFSILHIWPKNVAWIPFYNEFIAAGHYMPIDYMVLAHFLNLFFTFLGSYLFKQNDKFKHLAIHCYRFASAILLLLFFMKFFEMYTCAVVTYVDIPNPVRIMSIIYLFILLFTFISNCRAVACFIEDGFSSKRTIRTDTFIYIAADLNKICFLVFFIDFAVAYFHAIF